MKKIITVAIATIAVVAGAIGVQAFATSNHVDKQPATSQSTKPDDAQRPGYSEDHTGKPGETK